MLKLKNIYLFQKRLCSNKTFDWSTLLSMESRLKCIEHMQSKKYKVYFGLESKEINKYSAVLIPIVRVKDDYHLLYTLRSVNLASHTRQISFPGGVKDKTDKTYEDCALRETEEEIGLDRSYVDVWGEGQLLSTYYGVAVMPIIGIVENYEKVKLEINEKEVEMVFTVPIRQLCNENTHKHTQYKKGFSLPTFIIDDKRIWGLTALLTHQILSSLLPNELYSNKILFLKSYRPLSR